MTTFLDFIHFRSTRGLARRCRRYSHRLLNILGEVIELVKKAEEYAQQGEAKHTYITWKQIFEAYKEQEMMIDEITKNEQKVVFSDSKRELDIKKIFTEIEKEISADKKDKLTKIDSIFNTIAEKEATMLTDMRVQEKDIEYDRNRLSIRASTDQVYAWKATLFSRDEARRVKWEHIDEKHMEHTINDIHTALKNKKPSEEIDKLLQTLTDQATHFESEYLDEIRDISSVMKFIFNIHLRLVHHIENEVPSDLQKLKREGLSENLWQDMANKHSELVSIIKQHNEVLFERSRYLERHFAGYKLAA